MNKLLFLLYPTFLVVILRLSTMVYGQEATVEIDNTKKSEWQISTGVFGRFFELNGRDAYPGFISQHLANGSFEQWNQINNSHLRDELLFQIEKEASLAYPWQSFAVKQHRVFYEMIADGIHGKYFQRVINPNPNNKVGFYQLTALPDQRCLGYVVEFSARCFNGHTTLKVGLNDSNDQNLSFETVQLDSIWQDFKVYLELDEPVKERFQSSPFGIYQLSFYFSDVAIVDLDNVILKSHDAINNIFNPTTLAWAKEFRITSLRWPGGNYASMYRWTDAIGPWQKRPISENTEWGGLEPNLFGTNEFLLFCKLANIIPYINVPFNLDLAPPDYVAGWVEYVNGDSSTFYGNLRKKHGFPEPWGVKNWQIGNEHYGTYQSGYVGADIYARKIHDYAVAMKNVDPDINIFVAGADPYYTDHEGSEFNEKLLQNNKQIDGIDIHRYLNMVTVSEQEKRSISDQDLLQLLVSYPQQYLIVLQELIDQGYKNNHKELEITIGEWNLSSIRTKSFQLDYPEFAHAVFVAGMYNTFIKMGKHVKFAHQRDNTLYFRPYPVDFRPINPGAYVLQLYSEALSDGAFHLLNTEIEAPEFSHPPLGKRIMAGKNIPLLDAAALKNNEDKVVVFLVNNQLTKPLQVIVSFKQKLPEIKTVKAVQMYADDNLKPLTTWDDNGIKIINQHLVLKNNTELNINLKPGAVVKLELE